MWRGADVSPADGCSPLPNKYQSANRESTIRARLTPIKRPIPRPRLPKISLEPASPAVPAATEKNKHDEDDDEKCHGVHVALPMEPLSRTLYSPSVKKSSPSRLATAAANGMGVYRRRDGSANPMLPQSGKSGVTFCLWCTGRRIPLHPCLFTGRLTFGSRCGERNCEKESKNRHKDVHGGVSFDFDVVQGETREARAVFASLG
jgi:hypothetical protein